MITKEFKSLVVKAAKTGKEADMLWQTVALQILQADPAARSGMANIAYTNMHTGARHEAMTAWLVKFTGLVANTNDDKKTAPFKLSRKYIAPEGEEIAAVMEEAEGTPWYTMKPSKAPDQVLDIRKLLESVVSKYDRNEGAEDNKKEVLGADLAGAVRDLLNATADA